MTLMLAQAAAGAPKEGNEWFLIWGLVLLGAALLLLFLEFFVPSGGLIGMLAGVSAIGSIIAFFKYDTTWGLAAAISYAVLGPILVVFAFKVWLSSPLARRMILGGSDPSSTDLDNDPDSTMSKEHARQERLAQLRQLIGAQGVAVTPLRPVGAVRINAQRIDAMAESGVIDAGTPVIVTDVYDNQVKVRAV